MTTPKRRGAVVVTAAVAAVAVGTAAWAYYTLTSNTENATFTARSLAQATAPSAVPTSSTAVTVSWSLPASQVPGAQYVVTNTTTGQTACTVAATVSTCSDTAAVPGSVNAYTIKAQLPGSSWGTAATAFSSAATPPVLTVARTTTGALTAGTAFPVRVTAQRGSPLVTDTTYTGAKTVAWSGLTTSAFGNAPVYPATSLTFTNGVSATVNVTAFTSGSQTLTVTQGSSTGSGTFTIGAAAPALRFTSASQSCTSAGIEISASNGTFVAKVSRDKDAYGNTATFTGTPAVTMSASPGSKGTMSPGTLSFANATAPETSGSFTYTATSSHNGVSVRAAATGYTQATCSVDQV